MIKSVVTQEERLRQDRDTLEAMGEIYCAGNHPDAAHVDGRKMCAQCAAYVDYSYGQAVKCPNQHKGNCKQCSIKCYEPAMRAGIKKIMAYAGPRMLYTHPIMTARYLRKELRGKFHR